MGGIANEHAGDSFVTDDFCNRTQSVLAKCVLFNARSLNNKLTDFWQLLVKNYSCVFVTESWLKNSVTDGQLDNSGQFCVYRKDRPNRPGGGVLALISRRFHSFPIPVPGKFQTLEILAVTVVTPSRNFRFINVYRPPEFNLTAREDMKLLCDCLDFLCNTHDTVVLLGDFNLPHINWEKCDAPNDNIQNVFLDFCVYRGFQQFVNDNTHDNHCIDLVLTNDQFLMSNVTVSAPFSTSDHCMVDFDLILSEHDSDQTTSQSELYFDYDNADVQSMIDLLWSHPFNSEVWSSESFENICFTDSADDVWRKFLVPINNVIHDYVPLVSKRVHGKLKKNMLAKKYPRHIQRAMRKKHDYWKVFRKDRSAENKKKLLSPSCFV